MFGFFQTNQLNIKKPHQQELYLILPGLFIVIFVAIFPLIYTFINSFTNFNLLYPQVKFVGFENYIDCLTRADFWNSVKVTLILAGVTVFFELLIGLLVALVLAKDFVGSRTLRTILAIPVMMAPIAVGIIWLIIYNQSFGILNYVIESLGFHSLLWLGDPKIALFSVAVADIWYTTPFMMLLLIAGLQSIPRELYEAASIDGAGSISTFLYITLPSLKRFIYVGLVFRTMDALRIYDTVFVLTGGGPAKATETLSIFCYKYGFGEYYMGFTSAATLIFLVIIVIVTYPLVRNVVKESF